jgi:hypothetical protein
VIGVILSGAAGMLDDGEPPAELDVAHPDDALYSGMPCSVLTQIDVDRVLPAASIAAALVELLEET